MGHPGSLPCLKGETWGTRIFPCLRSETWGTPDLFPCLKGETWGTLGWGLSAHVEDLAGDCDGGDGGSFGTEDAGAEGDVGPVVMGEETDLFGGPAAFGADGEGVGITLFPCLRWETWSTRGIPCLRCETWGTQGLGEGEGLFGFAEQDAGGGGLGFERELERDGVGDLRDRGSA